MDDGLRMLSHDDPYAHLLIFHSDEASSDQCHWSKRIEFLATYGDYAGRLFETIKEVAMERKRPLSKPVAALRNAMFHEARNGGGKNTGIVRDCAGVMHNEGYDVDTSLAMMALDPAK